MIADIIRLVLTNLPILLFAAALIVPTVYRREPNVALRYLSWLLLLSVGVEMIWGGFFHIFFPQMASARIGWQASPFEFEIGVADAAMGIVAIISFWRSLDFKAAVVFYVVLFNIGVAIGHFREAALSANYAPDNFGPLLALTLIKAALLPALLWKATKDAKFGTAPLQGA